MDGSEGEGGKGGGQPPTVFETNPCEFLALIVLIMRELHGTGALNLFQATLAEGSFSHVS